MSSVSRGRIGSDRESGYRSSPLLSPIYLSIQLPGTPLSDRRRLRAADARKRELFTLYSDVSPTINDRSINESIKRESVREVECVYVCCAKEKRRKSSSVCARTCTCTRHASYSGEVLSPALLYRVIGEFCEANLPRSSSCVIRRDLLMLR